MTNKTFEIYLRKYESPRNHALFGTYSKNPNTIAFIAVRNVPMIYNFFGPTFAQYAPTMGDVANAARSKMPNTKPY